MLKQKPFPVITIIGTQFYQPISDLVSKLVIRPYLKPDSVSSIYSECGYSASIILLLVAMLESVVQRDRYFFLEKNPGTNPSHLMWAYAKDVLHYRRHRHLNEVADVRNSIAHNHIWEIEFLNKKTGGRGHKKSQVVPGTHRLRNIPPPNTRIPRTQRLKLNLKPSRLDRTDVDKVFSATIHFVSHLSRKGYNPINYLDDIVVFKKQRIQFQDLLLKIRETL
jgi:hypothetical protein